MHPMIPARARQMEGNCYFKLPVCIFRALKTRMLCSQYSRTLEQGGDIDRAHNVIDVLHLAPVDCRWECVVSLYNQLIASCRESFVSK